MPNRPMAHECFPSHPSKMPMLLGAAFVFAVISYFTAAELKAEDLSCDGPSNSSSIIPGEVINLRDLTIDNALPDLSLAPSENQKDNGHSTRILADLVLSLSKDRIILLEASNPELLMTLKSTILHYTKSFLPKEGLNQLNESNEKEVINWFKALRQTSLLMELQKSSAEIETHLLPTIFSNAKQVFAIHEDLLKGKIPQQDVMQQLKVSKEGLARILENNQRLKEMVLRSLPVNTLIDGAVSVDPITKEKKINWLSMGADSLNLFALATIGTSLAIQGGKLAGTALTVGNRLLAADAKMAQFLTPVAALSAYDEYKAGNKEFATIYGAMAIMGGLSGLAARQSSLNRIPKFATNSERSTGLLAKPLSDLPSDTNPYKVPKTTEWRAGTAELHERPTARSHKVDQELMTITDKQEGLAAGDGTSNKSSRARDPKGSAASTYQKDVVVTLSNYHETSLELNDSLKLNLEKNAPKTLQAHQRLLDSTKQIFRHIIQNTVQHGSPEMKVANLENAKVQVRMNIRTNGENTFVEVTNPQIKAFPASLRREFSMHDIIEIPISERVDFRGLGIALRFLHDDMKGLPQGSTVKWDLVDGKVKFILKIKHDSK